MNMKRKELSRAMRLILASAALTASLSVAAVADQHGGKAGGWEGEMNDAWIDGKVEASFTLNRYLNPFEIDTDVKAGKVTLTGTVESEIDKELAGEIARGIEGVSSVDNRLTVHAENAKRMRQDNDMERDFGDYVDDATITARVKYALLAADSTDGLSIDVDTKNGKVMLSGKVDSKQRSELAERLAKNTEGVQRVDNRLNIADKS